VVKYRQTQPLTWVKTTQHFLECRFEAHQRGKPPHRKETRCSHSIQEMSTRCWRTLTHWYDTGLLAYTLKMLGCFNPNLGKIWKNPNVGLKMQLKNLQLKVKVEVWNYIFNPTFEFVSLLPKFGLKQSNSVGSVQSVTVSCPQDIFIFISAFPPSLDPFQFAYRPNRSTGDVIPTTWVPMGLVKDHISSAFPPSPDPFQLYWGCHTHHTAL